LSRKTYRCSKCAMTFHPRFSTVAISIHIGSRRVLRCPRCGHKGFCDPTHEE
jgi:DNA-directed RNA polymerase subunit RPC12/RpoP